MQNTSATTSSGPASRKPAMFRPADIILAILLMALGFAMSFWLSFGQSEGTEVTATVDGELYGVYSLSENQTVTIRQGSGINEFEIKDGTVRMINANCHGHDCIQEGAISQTGETIVCLPHKIVLEITGGEADVDVIAQ